MRKIHIAAAVLLPVAFVCLLSSSVTSEPPEVSATVGRYQVSTVGSRGPQRFGTVFRLDTFTGKTWRVIINSGNIDGWTVVEEPEKDAPKSSSQLGTYRISTELISDNLGQDTAVASRIDTRTGKTWFLRPLPAPPAWVPLEN